MPDLPTDRCRLVLIAPETDDAEALAGRLAAALSGGDVASVLLPQYGLADAAFQKACERLVPVAQAHGAAAMIAGDSRVAARVGADGVHVEAGRDALADAIDRLQGKMMIGAGGVKTRDDALDLGELRPDYLFFGRFGYDDRPQTHPRNLALASWWAEMIDLPCILMAGSTLESVEAAVRTGAEFVAVSHAVFGPGVDPAEAVAAANRLLGEVSGSFEAT